MDQQRKTFLPVYPNNFLRLPLVALNLGKVGQQGHPLAGLQGQLPDVVQTLDPRIKD